MHCRRPFYLHVTRWNGHAINNHSQLRETTSFSCANARDNASSLVWHPKERSRQPEIIHPAGIAIGRVRTRRSHPNVHNCENGGRFPPRENLRVPLSTFASQPSKLFNRPTGFYFAVHLRERRRSLKTSAKKTWRHLPPPLGLLSRGGIEAKRPRCFENALLNRSTSPCFSTLQDKSSKKRAIPSQEKMIGRWDACPFQTDFILFGKRGGKRWTRGSIESGNFGLFVCFCAKMQTIYPSTKGGWERIDRTEVGTNSWLVSCFSPEMRNPRWGFGLWLRLIRSFNRYRDYGRTRGSIYSFRPIIFVYLIRLFIRKKRNMGKQISHR